MSETKFKSCFVPEDGVSRSCIYLKDIVNNIQNDRIAAHVLHFRVFHRRQSDQKASCPAALNLKMRRKLRLFRLLSI